MNYMYFWYAQQFIFENILLLAFHIFYHSMIIWIFEISTTFGIHIPCGLRTWALPVYEKNQPSLKKNTIYKFSNPQNSTFLS